MAGKNNARDWVNFELLNLFPDSRPLQVGPPIVKFEEKFVSCFIKDTDFMKVANTLFLHLLRSTKFNVWSPPESYFNVLICSLPQKMLICTLAICHALFCTLLHTKVTKMLAILRCQHQLRKLKFRK